MTNADPIAPLDFDALTDAQVLGLTGAAEARAEFVPHHGWQPAPIENMYAVMCVPMNRVLDDPARYGATVSDACFEHGQFSCWNPRSGSNHEWVMEQARAVLTPGHAVAPIVRQCINIATRLLDGDDTDIVCGATHYYSPVSMIPPGRVPVWARGHVPVATIGGHLFFRV